MIFYIHIKKPGNVNECGHYEFSLLASARDWAKEQAGEDGEVIAVEPTPSVKLNT